MFELNTQKLSIHMSRVPPFAFAVSLQGNKTNFGVALDSTI